MSVGGQQTKTDSKSYVSPEQAPYLQDLYGRSQNLANQPAINPTQRTGYNMALGFANTGAPDIYNQSMGAFSSGLNAADVNNNPYLSSAMNAAIRPLSQQYSEQVLPGIRNDAIGAGQLGSSRQGVAEGIASRGYLDAMGDITSRMGSAAYDTGLQAQLQTLGMAPNMMNLGLAPSSIYGDVGTQMQNAPWQQLQQYSGLLGDPTILQKSKSRGSQFNIGFGDGGGSGTAAKAAAGAGG